MKKYPTIVISDRFEITSDALQFILVELVEGITPKTNKPCINTYNTYHANMLQCCKEIVKRETKDAISVEGIIVAIEESTARLVEALMK